MPKNCTPAECRASALRVQEERPKQAAEGYARVPVHVEAFDGTQVTLRARDTAGRYHQLALPWASEDLWADSPSTLALDEKGNPTIGDDGFLYLAKSVVAAEQSLGWSPKWPRGESDQAYRPLAIMPQSIVIRGAELQSGDYVEATIELLDPTLASPSQSIRLAGASVEVYLSERGFNEFFLHFPDAAQLRHAVDTIKASGPRTGGGQETAPVLTDTSPGPADEKKSSRDAQALATAWQVVAAWSTRLERHEGAFEDERDLVKEALK
ncbi:MAG: hypothetical protein MUF34_24830 [Polyangiaceae bacterium]|jgi:hypothetical protein|nr:hypothetical protein [Polyangiaceae bacterium]